MPKIVFLIPYFGKFPEYFRFFIDSCKANTRFDFLFFTDIQTDIEVKNVTFIPLTLEGFNTLATEKIGYPISVSNYYKICDFKVAYGKIFEDYIKPYDFWGSCDADVILGNLETFLNAQSLASADVYSGVKWYLSGSLFLFRNNETLNTLFKRSADHQKVFQSNTTYFFEECGPVWHQMDEGVDLSTLEAGVESITHVLFNKEKSKDIRWVFTDSILEKTGTNRVLYIHNKIIMQNREYLLLHYIYLKTNYYFIIPKWPIPSEGYFVDKFGLHQLKEQQLVRYLFQGNFYKVVTTKLLLYYKRLLRLDFVPSAYKKG